MAPSNGSRRQANCPTELDNFNYLLQPGTQEPVEYIPVDDFFDQYLELLNFAEDGEPSPGMAKGARIEAKELPEAQPSGEGPSTDSGTGTVYGSSPPNSTSNTHSGDAAAAGMQPPTPMSRSESDATYTSSPPRQAVPYPPAAAPVGAPPITSGGGTVTSGGVITSGSVVTGQTVGGPPVISGRSAVVSGMPDQLQDRKVPQPKQRRRRVRDERQQMLNKLAQIRYRERKRSRVDALEGDVSALETQIAELRVRQAENADLAQQNRALEAQIEEKEAAIAQAQSGAGKQAQPTAAPLPADAGSPAAGAESARGGLPKDSPEDLDRLVKEWLAKSREIMDLVELIGLGDGNKKAIGRLKNDVRRSVRKTFSPKTRDVLKNVEARLSEMVNDVTTLCMRVMRLQGAQVEQLMTADYDMICSMKGWKEEAKWLKAARELNFSVEQRKRVLAARDDALSTLHQLYGERQALNAQVLHGLQPGLFNPASGDAAATAAAKEMTRLLDALGANLAAEQRELARQDFVLFRQLLTPIQAGLLVSISYPDHCDALAMMNAVYAVATG